MVSFDGFVKLWEDMRGVKAVAEDVSVDSIIAELPEGLGSEAGRTAFFIQEYGWDVGEGGIPARKSRFQSSSRPSHYARIKTYGGD